MIVKKTSSVKKTTPVKRLSPASVPVKPKYNKKKILKTAAFVGTTATALLVANKLIKERMREPTFAEKVKAIPEKVKGYFKPKPTKLEVLSEKAKEAIKIAEKYKREFEQYNHAKDMEKIAKRAAVSTERMKKIIEKHKAAPVQKRRNSK